MDDRLKNILWKTDIFLDFHSVISGFRNVGLIPLTEEPYHSFFNKKYGLSIPPFLEQEMKMKDYLITKHPDYSFFEAWEHLYFLSHNSTKKDCLDLLGKYGNPIYSKEGERDLGLLLSFPECCVTAHYNGEDIGIKKEFYAFPFAPCKPECNKEWITEYNRLANLYNIDINQRIIKT